MIVLKVSLFLLLAVAVRSEKKIELQDIEEDNLKSENEKDVEPNDARSQGTGSSPIPLEVLKSGFLRYFQSPTVQPQQPRYVQQYDVTEPPVEEPKQHYDLPSTQQAVVGYYSNVPMQVYLVPQYYNEAQDPTINQHGESHYSASAATHGVAHYSAPALTHGETHYSAPAVTHSAAHYSAPATTHGAAHYSAPAATHGEAYYSAPAATRVAEYQTATEAVKTQTNYIQVPNYETSTGKTFVQQQRSEPIAYFTYTSQPSKTVARPTVAPAVSYHTPFVQYTTTVAQQGPTKEYVPHNYQSEQYTDTNAVEDVEETVEQSPQHYPTHTEIIYHKTPKPEYTPTYISHSPLRNDYHHKHIVNVPHASQIIYKTPVQHVPHIPKALPLHRPPPKLYTSINDFVPQTYTRRPPEPYGPPFKRRPTSLLDSYIPSSVQIEYMKRGFAKDPLEAYEALSSGRHLQATSVAPRHFERGFLPNQMYHTAAGGVTFGHYKRSPKLDRSPQH